MCTLLLNENEISEINTFVDNIQNSYTNVEDLKFSEDVGLLAQELPRRLRAALHEFRFKEAGKGYFVLSGFPVDQDAVGATPSHWARSEEVSTTNRHEIFLMLCGSLLGDPLAWATQQDGSLVHNILPMKQYENEQLGFNSTMNLDWHVEDAFHEYRGDYLGMMCIRNPQQVPTMLGSVADINLSKENLDQLFEPQFCIKPDKSHLKENNDKNQTDPSLGSSFDIMAQHFENPGKKAVLFGSKESPYVRLDPYYMEDPTEPAAKEAYNDLVSQFENQLFPLVLQDGDIVFVDNFRMVHGRAPFQARYDGTDRWLKRINIARDLRKSRDARREASCRKIV